MAKINTYGLKMVGLRAACGQTTDWAVGSGGYTEIFYNRASGEIWTVDQVSMGHNSYSVYDDPDIIKVCETEKRMTMQQIADAICECMQKLEFG